MSLDCVIVKRLCLFFDCSTIFDHVLLITFILFALRDRMGRKASRMIKEMEDRFSRIKAELSKRGQLYNADIAELLGVSLATVRRDLEAMEGRGMLRRTHGGAVPVEDADELPFTSKISSYQDEKRRMASPRHRSSRRTRSSAARAARRW